MTGRTQLMENRSERPKFEKSEKRDRRLLATLELPVRW